MITKVYWWTSQILKSPLEFFLSALFVNKSTGVKPKLYSLPIPSTVTISNTQVLSNVN